MKGAACQSRGRWQAALFIFSTTVSFSYSLATTYPSTQPLIDYPRLLVSDTNQFQANGTSRAYVFEDSEILSMYSIVGNVYQSSMQYDFPNTIQVPATPVSYIRVAAYLLNSLAANKARLSGVIQLLDVKLSYKDATKALQDQAAAWLTLDDDTGAFAIIEQTQWGDDASFMGRYFREVQRQSFL
jgi:hypothetical protein